MKELIYTGVCLILGFGLKFWVERRKFYRRNESGMEEFDNFHSAFLIGIFEKIASFAGGIFILLGLLFAFMFIVRLFFGK